MSNWVYKEQKIENLEDLQKFEPEIVGFVYLITNFDTGKKYIR